MRSIVALAMHTGISVNEWLETDDRSLTTAINLFADEIEASKPNQKRGM